MTSALDTAILNAVRRLLIPFLSLACSACAPASPAMIQAPAVVQVPAPASVAGPPVVSAVPESVAPSRRPAFVLAVDGPQTDRFLVALLAALDPSIRQAVEHELEFHPGTLSQPGVLQSIGIDSMRPTLFGLDSLDERGRALMQEARRAAASSPLPAPEEDGDRASIRDRVVARLMHELEGSEVHFAFLVPVLDQTLALEHLERILDRAGFKKASDSQGFASVWTDRRKAVVISPSGDSVTIDLADVGERGPRALALLHGRSMMLRDSLRAAAPPLEGNTARMTFFPLLVAEVGFLDAVSTVERVARNMGQDYRARILQQGLVEANRIMDLAGGPQGAYFETVELALQTSTLLPGLSGVATAGPAVQGSAACRPSISLDFPDGDVTYDATNACLRSFRLPGDPEDGSIERSRYQDWVRDAGVWGRFASLPFLPGAIAREQLSRLQGLAPGALKNFERFGWMAPRDTSQRSLFWAMLPAGTSQRDAICAVSGPSAPCSGTTVLAAGRTQQIDNTWARLLRVGDRWVVLLSSDKPGVEKAAPTLTRAPVPAIRAELEARALRREMPASMLSFPLEAWQWRGSATWEGSSWRVQFQPVQHKP